MVENLREFCFVCVFLCIFGLVPRVLGSMNSILMSNSHHIKFYLYDDPRNYDIWDGKEMDMNDLTSIMSSGLKTNVPLKFLIHGFNHDYTCWFPQEVKDAYMQNGFKNNLIIVDWGRLATPNTSEPLATLARGMKSLRFNLPSSLTYPLSVSNVRTVGKRLSNFISVLWENHLVKLSTIHIIGFSLGAHIAGHAGHDIHRKYGQKIGRITGLDPAGPLFYSGFVGRRLGKSDARFVDVIHTDMAEYGIVGSIAHMDFFVNGGGPPQPGCVAGDASCSHNAAAKFYIQSIGKSYRGCRCINWHLYASGACHCQTVAIFGDGTQPGPVGSYFLKMTPEPLSGKYLC